MQLNERQAAVVNRLFDGFHGSLTTRMWAKLTHASLATAQRDINDLFTRGVLQAGPGGSKNTHYLLA
ncbi:MAG: hypothetical protein H7Z43_03195 [Clostridia bacterium]|nr:hypothetical protein [Deltaproteobacteria bacterium]